MRSLYRLVSIVVIALSITACSGAITKDVPTGLLTVTTECPAERPMMCTMDWRPVCGVTVDGESKTYGNGCSACDDGSVIGHIEGECAE